MSFDRAALTYDQDFSQAPLARWLRGRVWTRLAAAFDPGMTVLELGCGTGEDALFLAQRGLKVIATDASPTMLKITAEKAAAAGVAIQTRPLDLSDPATWKNAQGQYAGIYSNFGAINCTPHWEQLAAWCADHLPVGGKIAWGVMGRFCLWESLWHGLHGNWRTATRRWSGQNRARLADGSAFTVFYPSPATLKKAFAPAFRPTALLGLGVFLPPSDVYGVIESRPRWYKTLLRLESALADKPLLRAWGDHYWIEFQKQ
jgi:SAM-dependent methyltransferase